MLAQVPGHTKAGPSEVRGARAGGHTTQTLHLRTPGKSYRLLSKPVRHVLMAPKQEHWTNCLEQNWYFKTLYSSEKMNSYWLFLHLFDSL